MNLPNKLTVSRLIMAPLFFIAYFLPGWVNAPNPDVLITFSSWTLIVLCIAIELSDLLDGIIARRMNLITDLGKVLDPFADVISRITYFLCLAYSGIMPLWIFIIILYRELSVIFLRMIMMKRGVAMAANIWGKAKAVLYAVSGFAGIILAFLIRSIPDAEWLSTFQSVLFVLFVITAAASVISFITYLRPVIRSGMFK
ncbi:MAG: CDP-diacylglycerol--glycerol-3-phosphate 3-phosphatidyltransferase [Bacteroidetes bacterium]|nr:CDP-diacylglycerol--glycerol-3-phosphate 3-phosphatidyltransferase [Bacteroidota bacterium]